MKNLLLLLILANILYFMWGVFKPQDLNPGVAIVEESDLGPPLDVTTGQDSDAIASVGAVLGSGEPSDLEAVVGRSCVSIGPFKVSDDADSAVLEYNNQGMKAALRSGRGQIFRRSLGSGPECADARCRPSDARQAFGSGPE